MSYPVPHGIWRDSWYHGDTSDRVFWLEVPYDIPVGKHLRVVLTWDSNAKTATATNDLTDFDLYMTGDSKEYVSDSANSNIEIINIPQEDLTPATYYPFTVKHSIDRIPAGEFTYFCVAWTWAEDSANSLY
ncbi:hypothetical protein JXA32_14150, partial [Candidatus Sumerlaeota bacterium]|nr:hypothetical protein [Candidatus Sumerlaeota bacterium]